MPKPSCDPKNMSLSDYKYLRFYNRETVSFVNEYYADDFSNYGYKQLQASDFPAEVTNDISFKNMEIIINDEI